MTSLDMTARAILARVRNIGARLQDEPFLSQTDWLLLPVAKQEVVLKRLEALRAYDLLDAPTSIDALRAAKAAGVAIARFYQLVAHWRENDRSPFSLIPHRTLAQDRPTRLPAEETALAISETIRALVERNPLVSTSDVISHVRQTWTGPGHLPSDTAIRVFHERAVRSANPLPGTLTLNVGGGPQERNVGAEHFVDALVIDHVGIKGMAADEDGLSPTVTLALDLWSGSPMGAVATLGPANPAAVLRVLDDVSRRIGSVAKTEGDQRPPRVLPKIVMATTFAAQWRALSDRLLAEGFEVIERRDPFLHQGGSTRRLLGMALGPFRLERRADRSLPFGFDPKHTAVLPIVTIERLLTEAVDDAAQRRVPPDAWATAFPFDMSDMLAAFDGDAISSTDDASSAAEGPRKRGRPSKVKADLRDILAELARARTPGGASDVVISQADDEVWHLNVTLRDPTLRDAAFLNLAEGAMKISAAQRVPIIVHVDTDKQDPADG